MEGELDDVVAVLTQHLGGSVVGIYLYGSAREGGLRPDSDLDLLVVVDTPPSEDIRQQVVAGLLPLSGRWAVGGPRRPVEVTVVVRDDVVPWRFPPRRSLQYGDWLRADLSRGVIREPVEDPDLTMLLVMTRDRGLALVGPPAAEVLDPVPSADLDAAILAALPALLSYLVGDERNVLLTLARMWVTRRTGTIVSKDVAADRLLPELSGTAYELMARARSGYLGEQSDRWEADGPAVRDLAADLQRRILNW